MGREMIVRCRAPLRLGLAGGGTDVETYSSKYGGYVLNATIDRYVYVTLEKRQDGVVFASGDLDREEKLELADSYPLDAGLILHRAVYNHFIREYNDSRPVPLRVHTFAEAPIGSGLGTSSTLVVALVQAFAEYFNAPLDEYENAALAYKIERMDCNLAGGKQDQYAAAFGGVNFMEFMPSGRVLVNPLRVKKWIITEFEASLLLYFTGVSRSSGDIIQAQNENVHKNYADALEAMHKLREEAVNMKNCLLTGDFHSLSETFHRGWEWKKRMSSAISNSYIETIYNAAMSAGARAAKISGAGGGGFMMVISSPGKRMEIEKTLKKIGGDMFPAHFTKAGVTAWKL